MRRTTVLLGLTALLLGAGANLPTLADTAQSVRVGFQIMPFQVLSISGGAGSGRSAVSTVQVPQPSLADLERGAIGPRNAVRLTVRSNIPRRVTVRTAGGRYLTIDHQPQQLLQGEAGDHVYGVDYKTHFDRHRYSAGSYRIEVIYMVESR